MNISHGWLKAFLPHTLTPEQLRDLLTAHVATVEGLSRTRADLAPFVVARVVESEKIPDTKLSFNKVDDGSGTLLEVVCGAPNVTVGTIYPFARSGTLMPAGFTIEKKKIRGFTSNGMLCSARELGLGEEHDGILALDTDAAPGTPLLEVLPLSDVVLEVDVLPNRPDLLSHLGVAREVAALTGIAHRLPEELDTLAPVPAPAASGASEASVGGVTVRIEDLIGAPRYFAVVIRGVKVGPSPEWLVKRLEAIGSRSINNVVDATNYVLHGFGQPTHAFDLAKLSRHTVVVRRAKAGETLVTLDGAERKLTPEMLVIADADRAIAIAGVMGGRDSEVTDTTTDILLEVASFSAPLVRATRRALGMSSDASYRFERGIDDVATGEMSRLCAGLIARLAGATVESVISVGAAPAPRTAVSLDAARVSRLLGDSIPATETRALLTGIGFAMVEASAGVYAVTPPSWRHDVSRDVDLIEDVARLRGYDRLPDTLVGARPGTVPDHPLHVVSVRVRDALTAAGLLETKPLPYTRSDDDSLVRVDNPLANDEPFLRTSLVETLSRRAEYNLSRMQGNLRLFEVGTSFIKDGAALVREEIRVGALLMGLRRPVHFTEPQPPVFDAWDAKALAEVMARAAWPGARVALVKPEGEAAGALTPLWRVEVDGTRVGVVGQLTLDAPAWAAATFGIELTLGEMSAAYVAPPGTHNYDAPRPVSAAGVPLRYVPLPVTPAADFDLALLVPDALDAAEVEAVIRDASGDMLERLVLFDEFRGTGVPAGKRSLAWRLTFRHPERTLRDKEIDGRRSQLLKTLEQKLNVVPRTA